MSRFKIVLIISVIILAGYILLLGAIFYVEVSDDLNMKEGENSIMGELKILIGVMTGAVSQVLSFWFGSGSQTTTRVVPNTARNQAKK